MAERLYKRWTFSSRTERAEALKVALSHQLGKTLGYAMHQLVLNRPSDTKLPKYEHRDLDSSPETQMPESNRNEDPEKQSQTVKESGELGSVFEKLHSISRTQQEMHKLNEKIKEKREVQYCTFRPKTNATPVGVQRVKDPYLRLSTHSNKRELLKCLEAEKAARELQYCTFAPMISNKGSRSRSQQAEPAYSRLTRLGELTEQVRKTKEVAKRDRELDGCTFHPRTNVRSSSQPTSREHSLTAYDRLYREHEQKLLRTERSSLSREDALQAGCTFHPRLISRPMESKTVDRAPRHERLYANHVQKQERLEQKRKELEAEERRMHQVVSKMRRGNTSARSQQVSPRTSSRTEDLRGTKRNLAETFERLYNEHKNSEGKRGRLEKKVLQV
ncbi:MAG: hypothetical protein P4M11_11200 [Candidatus Pacebacteria bacterium]|nr:hypothetical protein [Candidatus Paceibacterota bacterium]